MRLTIVIFVLAVLMTAATTFGFAVWDGRTGHSDMRAIHYDTNYEFSSQRRMHQTGS